MSRSHLSDVLLGRRYVNQVRATQPAYPSPSNWFIPLADGVTATSEYDADWHTAYNIRYLSTLSATGVLWAAPQLGPLPGYYDQPVGGGLVCAGAWLRGTPGAFARVEIGLSDGSYVADNVVALSGQWQRATASYVATEATTVTLRASAFGDEFDPNTWPPPSTTLDIVAPWMFDTIPLAARPNPDLLGFLWENSPMASLNGDGVAVGFGWSMDHTL